MKRSSFPIILLILMASAAFSQDRLEGLKVLFPESIGSYKAYEAPQLEKVRVNGKDYYSLVAYYEVSLDTSFSFRLNDYEKEPEFIDRVIAQIKASQPFEDESEKWANLEIGGYASQLQFMKKYSSYTITTLIQEEGKAWLLTFSGNGMSEGEALGLLKSLIEALVKNS